MIGKFIYGEWLVPIVDYHKTLKSSERNYEIVLPIIIAAIVTVSYHHMEYTLPALLKLRDVLPAALAILIGFSITCITILISSNNSNIEDIKARFADKRWVDSKQVTIYQWFLIMFIYVLLVQIFLLLIVFFTAFILRVYSNCYFMTALLFAEVYFTLHILLLLTRNITNFYFVFFKNTTNNEGETSRN